MRCSTLPVRADDAEALLAKAFVKRPSEALYAAHAQRKSGEHRRLVTDRAIDLLETGAAGRGQPERYGASRSALMIAILTREERFAEAWAAVARHKMPLLASAAQQLAKLSGARHPLESSRVWQAQVDHLLAQGGNASYEAAYALLDRLAELARSGGSQADHAAYVTQLRLRHKAKRNFICLFEAQPPISARRFAT